MRDIVVITRSLLRCQMLFVVFEVYVMFQVIQAWDRTGVNVNGRLNDDAFMCSTLIFVDGALSHAFM